MHGTVTEYKKQRTPTREKVALGIVLLLGFFGAVFLDRKGLPQKWQAAIYGTIPPFALVIVSYRLGWRRWSFWASLGICLAIHTMAIFLFFQYVLHNVQNFGWLLWSPVAFGEMFVLFIAVRKVEQKLTGRKERGTLS